MERTRSVKVRGRNDSGGLDAMTKGQSYLNRSKSLRFQRNFDPTELLGMDPADIQEEEVALPIDAVTPLGEEGFEEGKEEELGLQRSFKQDHVSVTGISVAEVEVGRGEVSVLAFSQRGVQWTSEDNSERVFVVPASTKEDDVEQISPEEAISDGELTDEDAQLVDGEEGSSFEDVPEDESLSANDRSSADSEGNLDEARRNSASHLVLGPIESVKEEELAMEEVELEEDPPADDGEAVAEPAEAEKVVVNNERQSRGRERVRFAAGTSTENKGESRSRIRGILKTGRSVSAMPYSRIRVAEHEGEENEGDNTLQARKSSVNFFFEPDVKEVTEIEQVEQLQVENCFGFAGMDRGESMDRRDRSSNMQRGGSRRRARSVAAVPRRPAVATE